MGRGRARSLAGGGAARSSGPTGGQTQAPLPGTGNEVTAKGGLAPSCLGARTPRAWGRVLCIATEQQRHSGLCACSDTPGAQGQACTLPPSCPGGVATAGLLRSHSWSPDAISAQPTHKPPPHCRPPTVQEDGVQDHSRWPGASGPHPAPGWPCHPAPSQLLRG